MNKSKLLTAAVTGLLLTACSSGSGGHASGTAMGECHGVNGCKGKGQCSGAANECAGKNGCKGHGMMKMTKADCEAKGGTFKQK